MLQFMGSQRVGHDWVTELNFKHVGLTYLLVTHVCQAVRHKSQSPRDRFRVEMCNWEQSVYRWYLKSWTWIEILKETGKGEDTQGLTLSAATSRDLEETESSLEAEKSEVGGASEKSVWNLERGQGNIQLSRYCSQGQLMRFEIQQPLDPATWGSGVSLGNVVSLSWGQKA